ncbi:MAG: hypothetical protein ACI845_000457 [Gammaproteobacteria bacterium]|jgi:hypothetical protein
MLLGHLTVVFELDHISENIIEHMLPATQFVSGDWDFATPSMGSIVYFGTEVGSAPGEPGADS